MKYDFSDPLFRAIMIGFLLSLPFKVVGIWKSARNNQKIWFGSLLFMNTLGLLDLIYLFYFSESKKTPTD